MCELCALVPAIQRDLPDPRDPPGSGLIGSPLHSVTSLIVKALVELRGVLFGL